MFICAVNWTLLISALWVFIITIITFSLYFNVASYIFNFNVASYIFNYN